MKNALILTAILLMSLQTCNPPDMPVPEITGIEPDSCLAGDSILIHGKFLSLVTQINLGSVKFEPVLPSAKKILAYIPADVPPGQYTLFVQSPEGKSNTLPVVVIPDKPYVKDIRPVSAQKGDTLKIRGRNFENNQLEVHIADLVINQFISVTDTLLKVHVTDNFKSGKLTVENVNGESDASITFTFNPNPTDRSLRIESVDPDIGMVGNTVTITGKNFDAGELTIIFPPNIMLKETDDFTVHSGDKVTLIIPDGAATGEVSMSTSHGTVPFDIVIVPAPVITRIRPLRNKRGGPMLIYGTNLSLVRRITFDNTHKISEIQYHHTSDNVEVITLKVPEIPAKDFSVRAEVNDDIYSADLPYTVVPGEMTLPPYLPSVTVPNPPPLPIVDNINNDWIFMGKTDRTSLELDDFSDPNDTFIRANGNIVGKVNVGDNSIILYESYGKMDSDYGGINSKVKRIILTPLEEGNQVEMIIPVYLESINPVEVRAGDSLTITGRYFLNGDIFGINIGVNSNDGATYELDFTEVSESVLKIAIPNNILPGKYSIWIGSNAGNSNEITLTILP